MVVFESEDSTCSGCRFLENTIQHIGIESWWCQLFNKAVDDQARVTVILNNHAFGGGAPLTTPLRLAQCRSGEQAAADASPEESPDDDLLAGHLSGAGHG
jgi:hypothetical protein